VTQTDSTVHNEKLNTNSEMIDVYPIKKGKRILVYLADMLLNFVLSVLLFTAAIFPIARSISNYQADVDQANRNHHLMMDVLYDNNLLEYKDEKDKYDFDTCFDYSAELFVKDLVKGEESHLYPLTYFVSIKGMDKTKAIENIKKCDTSSFFAAEGFVLKDVYLEEFKPLIDEKDSLTNQGRDDLASFKTGSISSMYSYMLNDILSEETALPSYRNYSLENKELSAKNDRVIVISAIITYLLSCSLYFLLLPLLNKKGSTFGMVALKCIRLDSKNFKIIPRWRRLAFFISHLLFNLPVILFIPMMFVAFTRLFSLSVLFYMSLFTLVLALASGFVIGFNYFGKSLSDLLSHSILVDNETYDKILEARIRK
jgi:hypothetical protein